MHELTLRIHPRALALAVVSAAALVAGLSYVRAAGAPTTTPLAIEGTLTDAAGRPASGLWNFTATVFDVATGGTARATCALPSTTVTAGRFMLSFAASSPCVAAFRDANNTWVELEATDGTQTVRTGRAQVHAVPYALEADRASRAAYAATADDVITGSALEQRIMYQSGAAMAVSMCGRTDTTNTVDAVSIPPGSAGTAACALAVSGVGCLEAFAVYPRRLGPNAHVEVNLTSCTSPVPATEPVNKLWACCVR